MVILYCIAVDRRQEYCKTFQGLTEHLQSECFRLRSAAFVVDFLFKEFARESLLLRDERMQNLNPPKFLDRSLVYFIVGIESKNLGGCSKIIFISIH